MPSGTADAHQDQRGNRRCIRCGPGTAGWDRRATTTPRIRLRLGSTRWPSNQPASAGWCSRMGWRVVGRIAPARVTGWPTSALTRVDFPAPVDPPTTASSGASRLRYRGQDVVVELGHARSGSPAGPGPRRAGRAAAGRRRGRRGQLPGVPRRQQPVSSERERSGADSRWGRHSIIMPVQRPCCVAGRPWRPDKEKRPRADARDRFLCDPSGIRTRVTAVRGQRTRPLYDGAAYFQNSISAIQAQMIVSHT